MSDTEEQPQFELETMEYEKGDPFEKEEDHVILRDSENKKIVKLTRDKLYHSSNFVDEDGPDKVLELLSPLLELNFDEEETRKRFNDLDVDLDPKGGKRSLNSMLILQQTLDKLEDVRERIKTLEDEVEDIKLSELSLETENTRKEKLSALLKRNKIVSLDNIQKEVWKYFE